MFAASAESKDQRKRAQQRVATLPMLLSQHMRTSGGVFALRSKLSSRLLGTSSSSEQGSAEAMSIVAAQRVIYPTLNVSSKLRLILIS
jgi:hypothetical protein